MSDSHASLATGSSGSNGERGRRWARSGLFARIGVWALAVSLALVTVFAVLIAAVGELRHRSLEARQSQQVIGTANRLQTLVIDFETGLRGFVITNREQQLDPWRTARAEYPREVRKLLRLTRDNALQHRRAHEIGLAIRTYLRDYSVPLITFMRGNPDAARRVAASGRGARQVDAIRLRFRTFLATEAELARSRDEQARGTARTATVAGAGGLTIALLLILAAAGYLERAVARPIRLAARAARRVAGGDLSSRLPTGGPGEVGQLQQAFNTMAASLEQGREELEERNRRLAESERLKTELVNNVSHELRTPLASVLGFSDLMLKRELPDDDRRRYLGVIRAEAGRLATLLNDLLDLQRFERGSLELRRERFDLNGLLAAQSTLYSAQSASHDVLFDPAPDPVLVDADRDRLAQVFGNLLSNAIKYSPEGGRVEVRTARIGDDAWVWVRDFGLGIPAEHQDQVFTKFFRGDAGRKRGIAGTGLGLVLARQIVEVHDGEIDFESEEGRGSTFWVRIPAVDDPSPSAAGDRAESRHGV